MSHSTGGSVSHSTDNTMRQPKVRRPRRWHRLVIPFAVVLVLFAFSGVAYVWDEPNYDEVGTLSPTGTGPDGSSRLAALVAERGTSIERLTSSAEVVRAALGGDTTVFLPHPDYPNPNLLHILATLPAHNRVVLVEPGRLDQYALPMARGLSRWATRTREPNCAEPAASRAGVAAVQRTRYAVDPQDPEAYSCYGGGLVGTRWNRLDVIVAGSPDPFRNSRLGEHGNAELAAGLLSTQDRLLWLDLHAPERVSYSVVEAPGLEIDLPGPETESGGPDEAAPPNPLWTAVPPLFWPIAVQVVLVVVLLALWRARRLGPPVPEPLPVVVPAAETVTGRARLYDRADARGAALAALQASARHRILPALQLPAGAPERDIVAAAARRTSDQPEAVRAILYGGEPPDDDHLLAATAALDNLVQRLERRANP